MDPAWANGLMGGLLIGAASALYLLFNGRIAGTSGMIGAVLRLKGDEAGVQGGAFLVGAFAAAALWAALVATPSITITRDALALIASGLMVGAGVTLSNGCTSGHGVSGMSRFSRRSIVATLTFMAATAVMVWILRHGPGVTP